MPPEYSLREGGDPVAAHAFLTTSYWASGITLDQVRKSFEHSLLVSVWTDNSQVGMARIVTDQVTFAYLNDVYVLPEHTGKGLAGAMIVYLKTHPSLQGIRRWTLFTQDAQKLYSRFGWKQYPWPERMMIIDAKVFPK